MYTLKTHQWLAGVVAALLCIPLAATAQTESTVLHGRVSFDAGGTLLRGTDESDWSSGSINTLILPGDTVWVDNGGTTELEFSGGTFLRMADGSKAEVQSVSPGAAVRAWVGSFYVHRLNRSSGSFIFYTPSGIIEVDKDSSVRIDILDGELTTVSTRWGRATVRTDAGGSVQATAGRRVYVETGLLPSEPAPFDRSGGDVFDEWNRERSEFYATGSTSTPSAIGISANTIGASDLDRYGEWVTIDSTPFWRPTAVVDYTPYHHGYWNNVGPIGSVWVGNYPFSYVTSHHGYWDYHNHHGWIWSYTPRWSPAWAATVRYGDYFVWAPVNRHFRPVYPRSSAYFDIGGVSFGFHGTSYVHVDHLYHGPRYVDYAYHDTFRHYYGRGNVTVNIWNINTHRPRPYVNVPYNRSVQTVRNYTPRRNIRGASSFQVAGRSATDRVQRLESSSGRSDFSRASRTGGRFERTSASASRVANRTRVARIDQSTPDFARASRSNPVRATNDGPRRTDIDPRSDTPNSRSTASRNSGRTSESRTTTRTPSRSDRGNATTRTPSRSDSGNTTTRTPSRSDRGNATTRTPSRSDRGNATTRTPSRSNSGNTTTRTPSRSDRGNATTRTPSRSGSDSLAPRTPSRSDRGTTTTRTPSRSDRGNATTRTPSRSSSATSRSTSRSNTANSRSYRAPSSSSRTASTQAPTTRQSATPARSTTTTRSIAPRETAPSRSVTPRQSTPSRIAAPPQTRTPLYNNTPSSSGRSTTRNVAPSRSSSSSNRSVSTPAPRQSTPRATAPSRSTTTRSVGRAPSTRGSSTSARVPSDARRR